MRKHNKKYSDKGDVRLQRREKGLRRIACLLSRTEAYPKEMKTEQAVSLLQNKYNL